MMMEVKLNVHLSLMLDGSEWVATHSSHFTPSQPSLLHLYPLDGGLGLPWSQFQCGS
jgi:hypothetical protein